jgi:hypothetical protein
MARTFPEVRVLSRAKQIPEAVPSWMPTVETGQEEYRWRRLWTYELASGRAAPIGPADQNVWEAV